MATISVKNIPDHTYKNLKHSANTHHRSINSEIIYLIEQATTSKPFNPKFHLSMAKFSREKTNGFLLTEEILYKAKEEGRP